MLTNSLLAEKLVAYIIPTQWQEFHSSMLSRSRYLGLCLFAMVVFASFTVLAQSPDAPHHAGQSYTLLSNGEVLIAGGFDKSGRALGKAYLVDSDGKVTELASRLLYPRGWHTATALPDGKVLIFGGKNSAGHYVHVMEIFNPKTEDFHRWTGMPLVPRASQTATLLTDGRVLIIGGTEAGGTFPDDIQFWNFRTGKIQTSEVAPIVQGEGQTATLLPNGSVEISGGTDINGTTIKQPEVYDPAEETFQESGSHASTSQSQNFDVAESIPADGTQNVPISGYIKIRFSHLIDFSSTNSKTIRLEDSRGNSVSATVNVAEAGRLAFLIPTAPLTPGASYTVSLQGVKDIKDDVLPKTTISFNTEDNVDDGVGDGWIPGPEALSGNWGTHTGRSGWQKLPPLQAPSGVTAVAGQALGLSGLPLPHVTLQIGSHSVQTDNTGRFLLKGVSPGHHVLIINGTTADLPRASYGIYEAGIDVKAGITNVLNYTIWETRLDTAHTITIPAPTKGETVITTPLIPGLELRLPPNTTIVNLAGQKVTKLTITPIPLNKPPFPLPNGVKVPIYFTIQPGGSDINVSSSSTGISGAQLYYPNTYRDAPGTRFDFWNYDPASRGWYVYGQGSVSKDGKEVIPNPGVYIYSLSGAMVGSNGAQPAIGAPMNSSDGDPVDLSTGQFVYSHTDLVVKDLIPIRLTRTYITNDHYQRAFGIGTTLNYDMFMVGDSYKYTYQELILPNGTPIRFNRTSSGSLWGDAVYASTSTAGPWFGATLYWNTTTIPGASWILRTRTGMLYGFPEASGKDDQVHQALVGIEDRNGNRLSITRDSNALITQITSPSGRYIALTRDANGRIIQATDNGGRTVSYTYDSSGRLATVTDANQGVTTYQYDSNDLMTNITGPRNITYLTNAYDSSGRVIKQTQADGSTYEFQWTPSGNVTQVWVTSGSVSGSTIGSSSNYEGFTGLISSASVTDPRGYVRQVTFNNVGMETMDTRASGQPEQQTTTYQYYGDNLLQSVTDALGRTTAFGYDANGNETSVTYLNGTSSAKTYTATYDSTFNNILTRTDPLGHTVTYGYDANGNLTSVTDALGNKATMKYSTNGELSSVTDAAGDKTSFRYYTGFLVSVTDPNGNTTEMFPDPFGRVIQKLDPLGNATQYAYDNENRLTSVTNAQGDTASYNYDPNGDLLSVQDFLGHKTAYTYDSMDRVITKTDPLGRVTSISYDLAGEPVSIKDPKKQVTVHSYDGLGRLTFTGFGAVTKGKTTTYQSTLSYQYDAGNRMTSVTDSSAGTISGNFDNLNRLTSETSPQGTISYTYDAAGRLTSAQVTGGADTTYSYDAANRLTGITDGSAQVAFTYDSVNRRTSLTLPNGITVQYGYDQDSHITSLQYADGSTNLGNLTYSYDPDGRKTDVGGSLAATNLPFALGQATYDADNELLTWDNHTAAYDADGNMTTDINGNQYVWNARNQLIQVTGANAASFAYDAFGRRISKTTGPSPTTYLYFGMNRISSTTAGSTATRLSGGLDEYFMRTDSNGSVYPLTDAMGSVIALADPSGALNTTYWYSPYGLTTVAGVVSGNSTQYTGRENDGMGLYYYRARYYSPEIGRFISQDPSGLAAGLNMYAYAGDDPVNFDDPLGLNSRPSGPGGCFLLFCWGGGGGGAGGGGPGGGGPGGGGPGGPGASAGPGGFGGAGGLNSALQAALLTELIGGGPEDPIADALAIEELIDGEGAGEVASQAAQGYKEFQCVQCANAIQQALQDAGYSGKTIIIDTEDAVNNGNIYSDVAGKNISTNGVHYGVEVNGTVYDNISPNGLPTADWINSLNVRYGYIDDFLFW